MSTDNPMAASEPVEQRFVPPASAPEPVTGIDIVTEGTINPSDIVEALKDVIDPELGINIVDLGLVYGVNVDADNAVRLDMTLTSAACPLTDVIERQAQTVLSEFTSDVTVNWVWLPAWGPDRITQDGQDMLRALGFNV